MLVLRSRAPKTVRVGGGAKRERTNERTKDSSFYGFVPRFCRLSNPIRPTGEELRWARLGVISINHPEYPPQNNLAGSNGKKYTRAFQDMIIELREVRDEGTGQVTTKIRCVMRVDLGGLIPKLVFRKTVGQTGLMAFKAVRKKAIEAAKSR